MRKKNLSGSNLALNQKCLDENMPETDSIEYLSAEFFIHVTLILYQ